MRGVKGTGPNSKYKQEYVKTPKISTIGDLLGDAHTPLEDQSKSEAKRKAHQRNLYGNISLQNMAQEQRDAIPEPMPFDTYAAKEDRGDKWAHRSEKMTCQTCMHFCNRRCRRHAPTMQGYPAVYWDDWCGDHKIEKERM